MERKRVIGRKIKRIVVKIGTALLTKGTAIDRSQIAKITAQVGALSREEKEIILVSSGAIVSGMSKLKIKRRPHQLPLLQSCAAVGQSQLMRIYEECFSKSGLLTAQILLTADDLCQRKRYLNAKSTFLTLLKHKTIPVVNENDTVSVEEIKFGDNDKLAALVASLVEADMLIILSNVEGLCESAADEKSRIGVVKKIKACHREMACGPGELGTGGMITKLQAAKIAADSGICTVIANGGKKDVLIDIMAEKNIGTLFLPAEGKLASRKKWIAFGTKTKGVIAVDDGAKEALVHKGRSLLAAGIKKTEGIFSYGDAVSLADAKGNEFARGLINYSSEELKKIKGKKSMEIEKILGYKYYDEVVHRDNLVLLQEND